MKKILFFMKNLWKIFGSRIDKKNYLKIENKKIY